MPITQLQYLLLVGIPTASIIVATLIGLLRLKWFLNQMNARFDSLEKTLELASSRLSPYQSPFQK